MHYLLKKIFRFEIKKQKKDLYNDYKYDAIKGFWINKKTNQPLIFDTAVLSPRTKKADIETGEDRKGQ